MSIFPKIIEAALVDTGVPTLPLLTKITNTIINPLIVTFAGIAFVVFLWGVAQFIKNSANEVEKGEGKQHMLWGVIGLTIMLSALGILNLINSFWTE